MRVIILRPMADDGSVIIRARKGEARVRWRGDAAPSLGETDVELDFSGELRWGVEVVLAASGESLGMDEDGSVIAAVDGVDEDGVVKLRLSSDGLAMIAPSGEQPPIRIGDLVRIKGGALEIYPENL